MTKFTMERRREELDNYRINTLERKVNKNIAAAKERAKKASELID